MEESDAEVELLPVSRPEAERQIREFEERVYARTRRLDPAEMAEWVGDYLRRAFLDRELYTRVPPHFAIHALEATCAYSNPASCVRINEQLFAETINTWHTFNDPVLRNTLLNQNTLFEFEQLMHRQQLTVQGIMSFEQLARSIAVYGEPSTPRRAYERFESAYGLRPDEWMIQSFTINSKLGIQSGSRQQVGVTNELLLNAFRSQSKLDGYLNALAATPSQVREAYRLARYKDGDPRQPDKPLCWPHIPTVCADRPILRFPRYIVVPSWSLFQRATWECLHRCWDRSDLADAWEMITKRFELYAAEMLEAHFSGQKVYVEKDLEVNGSKSCDILLDGADCILLLECKAVMLRSETVTQRAILDSTVLKRICEGATQIANTARRVRDGGYPFVTGWQDKPILGTVVTYREVPGVGSPEIRARIAEAVGDLSTSLKFPVQCMGIEAVEDLAKVNKFQSIAPVQLFAEKGSAERQWVGDWEAFLRTKLVRRPAIEHEWWRTKAKDWLTGYGVS